MTDTRSQTDHRMRTWRGSGSFGAWARAVTFAFLVVGSEVDLDVAMKALRSGLLVIMALVS